MLDAFRPAAAGFGEEFFEDADAVVIEHARGDLGTVIEVRSLKEVPEAAGGTTFDVGAAEDDAAHAAVHDGTGAHGARLLGDVEIAIVEPPVPEGALGLGEREHFGMGGGVLERLDLVPSAANDIALMHDHGADGHFVLFRGLAGLPQRFAHEMLVVKN